MPIPRRHTPASSMTLPFTRRLSAQGLLLFLWIPHIFASPSASSFSTARDASHRASLSTFDSRAYSLSLTSRQLSTYYSVLPTIYTSISPTPTPTSSQAPVPQTALGSPREISPLFLALVIIGGVAVLCVVFICRIKCRRRQLPPSALYRQSVGVVRDGEGSLRVGRPSGRVRDGEVAMEGAGISVEKNTNRYGGCARSPEMTMTTRRTTDILLICGRGQRPRVASILRRTHRAIRRVIIVLTSYLPSP
ncbi:hypothetical protein L227DRAFT_186977 [Lentinus tigrinus ALCF2SS1-6]|uniref:Uncharacterized protein n=1 Tax=Lentinus tigrinus ALCF2SS1-6 TaxID=1328759 RepID=A0A5C2S478_9APHY|nr:hypothetical protein L227DRAFT_186977 [Lentinus tigrinus ALCF2SS1-6]